MGNLFFIFLKHVPSAKYSLLMMDVNFEKIVFDGITKRGGSNNWIFSYSDVGKVKCPLYLKNRRYLEGITSNPKHEWINLCDNRQGRKKNSLLERARSSENQKLFYKHIREACPGFLCIQEFIIPITNLDLWRTYLAEEGETSDEYWYRSYISADIFIPDIGWIIELDDKSHLHKRQADKARDRYVEKVFGIKTQRKNDYAKNNSGGLQLKNSAKTHRSEVPKFTEIAIQNFKEENFDILPCIEPALELDSPTSEILLQEFPELSGDIIKADRLLEIIEILNPY